MTSDENTISDVSFIVIARNEEFAVRKCLDSIAAMSLENCEVLCVDSDSTDKTLEVMKGFRDKISGLSVFRCSGKVNAAIGRNVGIRHASKKYVFFVDGDVEPAPEFVAAGIKRIESGRADAVVGNLCHLIYNDSFSCVIRKKEKKFTAEREIVSTGGILLASASMIEKAGFYDERMDRNEDLDFSLRIARHGRLLAIPVLMGTHHTLDVKDHQRYMQFLKQLYPVCFGMAARKHLACPRILFPLVISNGSFCAGLGVYLLFAAALAVSFISGLPAGYSLIFGLVLISLDMMSGIIRGKKLIPRFVMHYLYTPLSVAGVFLPLKIKRGTAVNREQLNGRNS